MILLPIVLHERKKFLKVGATRVARRLEVHTPTESRAFQTFLRKGHPSTRSIIAKSYARKVVPSEEHFWRFSLKKQTQCMDGSKKSTLLVLTKAPQRCIANVWDYDSRGTSSLDKWKKISEKTYFLPNFQTSAKSLPHVRFIKKLVLH